MEFEICLNDGISMKIIIQIQTSIKISLAYNGMPVKLMTHSFKGQGGADPA